mgnify:CR=1 FL=1
MRRIQVVSLANLSEAELRALRQAGPGLVVRQHTVHDGEDAGPHVAEAEVVLTFGPSFSPLEAPRLRWVQLATAGADAWLDHPILQRDVLVTTASGIHAAPIAEHILAMMLAWVRRLPQTWRWQSRREWPRGRAEQYQVQELEGATLGIVGYGSIGRHLARLARGLGMRVLALRRSSGPADQGWVEPGTGDPAGEIPERLYGRGGLVSMLRQCDFVAVTLPLTARTRHLIGARELAAMKSTAFLVNVSRGQVIDEQALIAALEAGMIGGAGLDVFETEPLPPDSPLYRLENVILTPHVAGLSPRYNERLARLFAENLRRYVSGEPLLNVVDRRRGY